MTCTVNVKLFESELGDEDQKKTLLVFTKQLLSVNIGRKDVWCSVTPIRITLENLKGHPILCKNIYTYLEMGSMTMSFQHVHG